MLVGGGIGYGVLYCDATRLGFELPVLLPDSHVCDSVLATHAAPLTRNGDRDALLVGTFGHELMMYQVNSTDTIGGPAASLVARAAFEAPIYALLQVPASYVACLFVPPLLTCLQLAEALEGLPQSQCLQVLHCISLDRRSPTSRCCSETLLLR